MEFLKWIAAALLLIMALTWSAISVNLGVMVAVSDQFYWVAGVLVSIVSGQGVKSAWDTRAGNQPAGRV